MPTDKKKSHHSSECWPTKHPRFNLQYEIQKIKGAGYLFFLIDEDQMPELISLCFQVLLID